jgi:soluble lytic murein transglycosylase-like protein
MKALALLAALAACSLVACTLLGPQPTPVHTSAHVPALRDAMLSWHVPTPVEQVRGLRLLADAPRPAPTALAVVRFIVRANPRLSPLDALMLASSAIRRAKDVGLAPEFFCATILQESAFSPEAVSSAAAVGIAQFTLETADGFGVDPFDWRDALRGAALLLGGYVLTYRDASEDAYVLALAAYNAGPGAVERYHGVPPYAETRGYIGDIIDRWARIDAWER